MLNAVMKNLDAVVDKIEKEIKEIDAVREKALAGSRDIIIACRKGMQLIHRKRYKEAGEYINKASKKLVSLYKLVSPYPEIRNTGFIENAAQEVVEGRCILNVMNNRPLPDPEKIEVSASTFLLGLCDAVGEMRRFALDAVRENRIDDANNYLDMMELIYESIMKFDYPSSLIPIKKRQDVIRGLIEKTRSELAVASCERRIQDKIEEFRGLLQVIEKKKNSTEKRVKRTNDLNIDDVW